MEGGRVADDDSFADLLREHRLARRMTQSELAERARMSVEAISALERGFRRAPQRQTVLLLVQGLDLDARDASAFTASAAAAAKPVPRRRAPSRGVAHVSSAGAAVPRLIGRERDVAALRKVIHPGALVTVCGTGGIGKTVLAKALAAERNGKNVFVALGPLLPGGPVWDAVARAFHLPAGMDLDEIVASLCERRALLVLDNCEHLADQVATLAGALLRGCPGIAVLATSRQHLGVPGENVYDLAPLDVASAIVLFAERAREVDARFALGDLNRHDVAGICSQLDGIALAVEIAARRTRALSPAEIHERLDRRFRLLVDDGVAEPRQQTVAALIGWSYDLLAPHEQRFFARLSIFTASFTLEAAAAVALGEGADDFDALDVLESLIAKSLVVREALSSAETRFAMLETLRAYGADRLAHSGDLALVQTRLVAYAGRLFEAAGAAYEQEARVATLARLDHETYTFTAALDAARSAGLVVEGARLFARVPALRRWLRDSEIVARSTAFLAALESHDDPGLLAYLHIRHGNALSRLDAPRSLPAFERALASARRAGDDAPLGRALVALALGTMRLQRFDDARAALDEAASLETSTEAQKELRHTRALLALYSGDACGAATLFEAIADTERALGNDYFEFDALHCLAEAHAARGAFAQAKSAAALAEPLYAAAGNHQRASFRSSLAAYSCLSGDAARALASALEAVEIVPRDNVWPHAFRHAAFALALLGDIESAATFDGFATDRMRRSGFAGYATERIVRERLDKILAASLDAQSRQAFAVSAARLSDNAARDALRAIVNAESPTVPSA